MEAGAEDLADQGDTWQLTSAPQDLHQLQKALEEAGITFDSADLTMLPTTEVPLESEGDARKVLKLIDALEEHDDVQNVYSNFDIPDSVLQAVEAERCETEAGWAYMATGDESLAASASNDVPGRTRCLLDATAACRQSPSKRSAAPAP
ncbi:MAG: YebC/PmpR family DNA-binding transcriptional regulator, partial [Acidimicrobiia bacterium]|nr:YebC/PmpR family DNA-binding transcriptional regulator [Acidimicrobiia bacterium]